MGGSIPCFAFCEDDIVLIGDGGCASQALADALGADAVAIVLRTRESWIGANPGAAPPDDVIFDTGIVPQNRETFECLARAMPGARIFLAGEIPRETAFRPPPILHFRHAAWGESPRRLERRALEDVSADHGFLPASLHDVHDGMAFRDALNPFERRRLAHELQQVRRMWSTALDEGRRPPFDPVREVSDTAMFTDEVGGVVYGVAWRKGPFDTAYFDAQLAEGYATGGVGRVVIDSAAIFIGGDGLFDRCGQVGLDLHAVDAGVE